MRATAFSLAPAAIALWGLHPAATIWSLLGRRRKRSDGSLFFWLSGLSVAPFVGLSAIAAYTFESQRWDLLFGWMAIWGWAGTIVHGMLTRIIPFLVWLQRFAPLVGDRPVPSVRGLLPDRWTRIGLALHLGTFALGVLAIASGWDWASRGTGLALVATGGWMCRSFLHVALRRPAPAEAR
jgi:hypothetical protein